MKRMICVLSVVILVLVTCNPAMAVDQPRLSNITDDECIDFLEDYGVDIPGNQSENESWIPFIRAIIRAVEENPETGFAFGYTVALRFAYEIKAAVNEYYAVTSAGVSLLNNPEINLMYNVKAGDWVEEYGKYNCYAYAIGETEETHPGWISKTGDKDADNRPDYIETGCVLLAAECVRDDLVELGYTVTKFTTTQPNTSISEHTKLICIRTDVDGFQYYGFYDYHLMKKGEDGNWYHKPGFTNPLRYLYTPSNGNDWIREYYDGQIVKRDELIYYIEYITPHKWNYEATSTNQHTRTCTICGVEETINCDYSYTYAGENRHTARCSVCNRVNYYLSCTLSKTSNGNGYHTVSCGRCDHVYTEICNLEYTNINNTRHSATCTECGYYVNSQLCTLTYTSRGNKTHTASCSQCNNTYTGNCSIAYSYLSANQHRGSCNKCSYTHTASCYYLTTYCGNSSLGDVHKKQCQTCGHISGSATTACSLIYKSNGNNTHSYQCTQCGYVKSGPTACMFKSDNTCKFCGAMKNSAVINDLEQEETA